VFFQCLKINSWDLSTSLCMRRQNSSSLEHSTSTFTVRCCDNRCVNVIVSSLLKELMSRKR
jgi:hypothetical protein